MNLDLSGALFGSLVGFPFGVLASFIAWMIVFRWIVPSIVFSKVISKVPPLTYAKTIKEPRYKIKFLNIGRRGIVDVEVMTRLRVRCLSGNQDFANTWTMVTLRTDTMREPRIPPGASRSVVLELEATPELGSPLFVSAINGRDLTLETLLSLGMDAEVAVWVFGYDDFSGSRKAFASKKYRLEDIAVGKFNGLAIEPFNDDRHEVSDT
jgi:hypothetical protein